MVRRRGRPRRSYAWLRQQKYAEKWTHKTVPIRFKLLQPPMAAHIETELIRLDYLEVQVFALLQGLGVPESEWPYYMAFAKRVYETFMGFWYDTAITEVYTLIAEFVQRGLVEDTLKAVADVALEKCTLYRPWLPPLPPFVPPYLWKTGGETGDFSEWDGQQDPASQSIVAAPTHHGNFAIRKSRTLPLDSYDYKNIVGYTKLYFLEYVRFNQWSNAAWFMVPLLTIGGFPTNTCEIGVIKDILIFGDNLVHWYAAYWDSFGVQHITYYVPSPNLNQWYELEIGCKQDPVTGFFHAWIDGTKIADDNNVDTSGSDFSEHDAGIMNWYGAWGATPMIIFMDCFAIGENYITEDPYT